MKIIFLLLIFAFSVSGVITADAILVGDGKKESDVILVGKIVSFEENKSELETNYVVQVEEYLKTPKNYDTNAKTVIIISPGLRQYEDQEVMASDEKIFNVGDRVLFLLYLKNNKLRESLYSLATKSDCTPKQLLDEMYGPSGLDISQNNQSKHLYTNKPVDITFHVYNRDLSSEKKDLEFQVFTPNGTLSERMQVQLQECKRSAQVKWSFIPTIQGKYTFGVILGPDSGGSESYSGISIIDYVDSPLKQYKRESRDGIKCHTGLELLQKASGGFPACVKSETKTELVKRGWGSETWPFNSIQGGTSSLTTCEQNGGNWLGEYKECEYVSAEQCSLMGGQYEEKSSCRHNQNPSGWCAGEGIPVCTMDNTSINNTEHSKLQREITILSISPKNVTLPDNPKDKPKITSETKIPINKSKQIKITNNNSATGLTTHYAQVTIKSLTIDAKGNPPAKSGFDMWVFDYSIENTDKSAHYTMLNFEVQFGQKTYSSELVGDEFYWMLDPDEKRDASYAIQVGKGINQAILNVKDQTTKKTLWSIPLDLTPYKIKYHTGYSNLIQE